MLFLASKLSAQLVFENLREADGLSAKQVRCLYKDSEGFLWIGTSNGLNRYDGHLIKPYNRNIYVNAIHPIDGVENLLIGTSKGLLIFNKKQRIFLYDERFDQISTKTIWAIKPDGHGRLWFVTDSDLFVFENNKLRPVANAFPFAKILKGQDYASAGFAAFCWDSRRNGFWIGGAKSFFVDLKHKVVYHKDNNPLRIPFLP